MVLRELILMFLVLLFFNCAQGAPWQGDEKRNETGKQPATVPLEKLPVVESGMIVVTPDLKKALDALGAGSVVLSAERYQELMNRTNPGKGEKPAQEMLFAKCMITGEVKALAGRESVELTFDLEFRTESPQALVPVPFKGLRLISATLNGQPPVWGPDPEKWTLLVALPQNYRLKLTASVPVTRTATEKRLVLERVPASAITSLEVTVPGTVINPTIVGYGGITATTDAGGTTLLSAPALGVLSSLELSWQTGDTKAAIQAPSIDGDVRIVLDDATAQIEARLKSLPLSPITLPWKIKLPRGSQQLRAELLRNEGMNSEPLVATQTQDGCYLLNSPYPLVMTGFNTVLVRWQVPLPVPGTADTLLIGCCEVLSPAGRVQQGTLQVNLPEDTAYFLKPWQVQTLEKSMLEISKDARRQRRYRYQQLPAGLEVIPPSKSQARGIVEARVLHTLIAQAAGWQLSSDIEILRSNRANVAQLELNWPEEWTINRRLLFSPVVKDIEQDAKRGTVRIILDGRQPAQQIIRVEGQQVSSMETMAIKLPQLVAVTGATEERSQPIELVVQQETLKVDAVGVDVQVTSTRNGLQEDQGASGSVTLPRYFRVVSHPAALTASRLARLPKYTSQAEVFVDREVVKTRQTIVLQSSPALPRQLQALVPASVKQVQFAQLSADGKKQEALPATVRIDEANSPWKRYLVDMPMTTESTMTLVCRCEADSKHPITVPLVKLDESQAVMEGTVTVQMHPEAGIRCKLPLEPAGWSQEQHQPGRPVLQSSSLQSFLVLEREDEASQTRLPRQVGQGSETRIQPVQQGYLIESEIDVPELLYTRWMGGIGTSPKNVELIGWKLNGNSMPLSLLELDRISDDAAVVVNLPTEYLSKPTKLSIAWRLKAHHSSYLVSLPILQWLTVSDELMTQRYLIQVEPGNWLGATNLTTSAWTYPQQAWKPVAAQSSLEGCIELQGSKRETILWMVLLPRHLTTLCLSIVALLAVQVMSRWPMAGKRLTWFLLGCWLLLYLLNTTLATVVMWSILPGLILGLLLQLWHRRRVEGLQRRPVVFQTSPRASRGGRGSTVINPAPMTNDAPTILANRPS